MNGKVTLALVAAAALAVGALVWFDRDLPGTQASALSERQLLPHPRARGEAFPIDRLEITGPDGTIVLAKGPDRAWRMLSPVSDRADAGAVRDLVAALETALKIDAIPTAESDLEKFGLREPAVRLRIQRGSGEPVELQIGRPTAVEGKVYARLAGSAEVVVLPDLIRQLARRSVEDFRDGLLLNIRPVDVARIAIQNPSGSFELQRDRGRWELVRPVVGRADDKAVNEWLERLCTTSIRQFVGIDLGDLLAYGLAVPRGLVRLDLEAPTDGIIPPVEIQFGNRADPRYAPDCVYVRAPGRWLVAAVPLVIEEALLLDADALRDRTLFSLNPDLVDRVRIGPAGKAELVLARRGEGWTMQQPRPMAVEATEAMRLLKKLPETRVREFLVGNAGQAAAAELAAPRLRVTFASFSSENTAESVAGESPIVELSFGPPRPDGSMLVRMSGEGSEVLARVDADILAGIPTDPIAWQPLRLFGEKPLEIESFAIERVGASREFRRDNGVWGASPADAAVAANAIESAAALVAKLRAVRWVGPAAEAHGLDAPTLIVRARRPAGAEAIELRIGRRGTDGLWPATLNGREGVFLLSDPDYQVLAALAP